MSSWPGKFVIGLTGNIATGKSMVRRMLEYMGAEGIDADRLAHSVISQNTPGYHSIVQRFGDVVLAPDGEIDRTVLGNIVFNDQRDLRDLESIVHPLVEIEISNRIEASHSDIFVIEAIKLIEANLIEHCDTIWVTFSKRELQLQRLVQYRRLNTDLAEQRISIQMPQEEKIKYADVIITNQNSIPALWEQVRSAWLMIRPEHIPPAPLPQEFITINVTHN